MTSGTIGQLADITSVEELEVLVGQTAKLGISLDEIDCMRYPNFTFSLNGNEIQLGKTGMYETCFGVAIDSFTIIIEESEDDADRPSIPPSLRIEYTVVDNSSTEE